jgi:hypothetical protein
MSIHDHWTIRCAGMQDIAAVLDLWTAAGTACQVPPILPTDCPGCWLTTPKALLVAADQ